MCRSWSSAICSPATTTTTRPARLKSGRRPSSEQVVGGRNGYGAKLANVFSTEFKVETCDGKNRRLNRFHLIPFEIF